LVARGYGLLGQLETLFSCADRKNRLSQQCQIIEEYRAWYNAGRPLVEANLPESYGEFSSSYAKAAKQTETMIDRDGDLLYSSLYFETPRDLARVLAGQLGILRSIPDALESKALSLKGLLARDLLEDELAAASYLLANGYLREAGVIAGVVLERHLRLMCERRGIEIGPKDTLGQLNDRLRDKYPDAVEYRRVQMLNEIRITCAHDKKPGPEELRVQQLITGVKDFVGTIL